MAEGGRARVAALHCPGQARRLEALGILPGSVVTVINNSGRGPLLVEVRGSRVALGRGVSGRIQVEPGEGDSV